MVLQLPPDKLTQALPEGSKAMDVYVPSYEAPPVKAILQSKLLEAPEPQPEPEPVTASASS